MDKKSRNILSFLIAIILMFTTLITSIILLWDTTIINEKTYTKIFEKNNTYNKIHTSINEDIEYLLLVNNIPTDTLNGIISVDEINQFITETTTGLVGMLKGEEIQVPKLDKAKYEQRFTQSMNKFIRENGMALNEQGKKDLQEMKETVIRIIDSGLQLVEYSKLTQSNIIQKLAKVLSLLSKIYIPISLTILILLITKIFKNIWSKRPVRASAWTGYSFLSSGMIIFMFGFSGYISRFYKNIAISIPYLSESVSSIIEKYLLSYTTIGLIILILGIFNISKYWKHLYKRYI